MFLSTRAPKGVSPWQGTPGTWIPITSSGELTAMLCCSNGHQGMLAHSDGPGHEISTEGVVSPSVVCTTEGCDFHELVTLVGWADRHAL